MISFAVAATHPGLVRAAIPIGGALPSGIEPAATGSSPPILALHGKDDAIVPVVFARQSVSRLRAKGRDATLVEYPGVPHAISSEMQERLFREIAEQLKKR